MKRSDLKRKSELRADPEKTAEFVKRGRGKLKRGKAKLDSKPKRRPKEGPLTPQEYRRQAFAAAGYRCSVSGARARGLDDALFDVHHPLPKRELRARGLYDHVWDVRNAVVVQRSVHVRHEMASKRIPREKLPASVWEFCAQMDALGEGQWATVMVERFHPAAGSSGANTRRS